MWRKYMGFFMLKSQNKLVFPGDILALKCAFGILPFVLDPFEYSEEVIS